MGVWGSNLTILTHEYLRFQAIKFDEFWFIWRRLKFDAMKFELTKYGANGFEVKF